ncbi:MAG: HPt (histidine-containing phosphotransfer) domain-containing protein [Pseudohongiellaceae bacterium]|jgi:HPt (histidine-containing phosphotransfer) domain-containing protein
MSLEHLDIVSINGLREIMGDEFPQLIDIFISDSELRINTIAESVTVGDPEAIRRAAHTLKGSASNMGASALTHLCHVLEDLGHEGRTDGAQEMVEEIAKEFSQVKAVLKTL